MKPGNPFPTAAAWTPWPWQDWLSAWGLAADAGRPAGFTQPILPGWTIGNSIVVNEANSSSPQTEQSIVAAQSYGRQLGRILDALAVLIEERPAGSPPNEALLKLLALHKQIDAIKVQVEASRIDRLKTDLARLRQSDPKQYRILLADVEAMPRDAGSGFSAETSGPRDG
jgi:hypothetical protein